MATHADLHSRGDAEAEFSAPRRHETSSSTVWRGDTAVAVGSAVMDQINRLVKRSKRAYSASMSSMPLNSVLSLYDTQTHHYAKLMKVSVFIFFMLAFSVYSLSTIFFRQEYSAVSRQDTFLDGSNPLPQMMVSFRCKHDFLVKVNHTKYVRNVHPSTITEINTTECQIDAKYARSNETSIKGFCFPSRNVGGTYGDPVFEYVKVSLITKPGNEFDDDAAVLILAEDRPTPLHDPVFRSHRLSFLTSHKTGWEFFFREVVGQQNDAFGLGYFDKDIRLKILPTTQYLTFSHSSVRQMQVDNRSFHGLPVDYREVLAIFFRVGLVESYEFADMPNLLDFLEMAGGLWTGLAFVASAFVLFCFFVHEKVSRIWMMCGRGKKLPDSKHDSEDLSSLSRSSDREGEVPATKVGRTELSVDGA
eukprot:TRINITY_DN42101_c0_g1_i1.p1 TRINITY_DN42101_c0_g1~~TRINITY_DN42101_c0_g1_i1.p1  ORF type:complete len:418 (-),score=30.03 TRINITY_DN42101_c0_g1_i1:46-1299(-)